MKIILMAASAAISTLLAGAAPTSAAADPLAIGDISWQATPANGAAGPQLRIKSRGSNSDVAIDGTRRDMQGAEAALRGGAGPVSFTVAHDAGTLDCTGALKDAFEGEGRCRFTSDPRFEAALAERGLAPDSRSDLLAMLMVDATIALADGLTREGLVLDESDDLIAAAALKVTPDYVHDLKSEAIALTDVEDAIACKALDVDGAYVRALAAAGYRNLSADDVVGMKAMGVTGDYAQAMNRAAGGTTQ